MESETWTANTLFEIFLLKQVISLCHPDVVNKVLFNMTAWCQPDFGGIKKEAIPMLWVNHSKGPPLPGEAEMR